MDKEKLVSEVENILSNGNILSLSKPKLVEYIQALSCVNGTTISDGVTKSSTQAQALTAIYNINAIKKIGIE